MQRICLKDRSFSADELPSEVGLMVELIDLCNNDEATFETFSTAIRKDTSLTSKVLRIANSPAYRQWNKISDLRRMLIILGLKNVKKIIITSAVQQFFSKLNKNFNKSVQLTWLRSLVCAHLAESIAKSINHPKPEEAYLAGLLHQLGILLLLANYQENYQSILDQYYECADFRELERENYGLDHCELGAALIESWELDSLISDAVLFQYAPINELASSPTLLKIVAAASPLSSKIGFEVDPTQLAKAAALLNISEESLQSCLEDSVSKSKRIIQDLGFDSYFFESEDEKNSGELNNEEFEERIRNIAMSCCFSAGDNESIADFVKELRLNFSLLFNLKNLLFLRQKDEKGVLTPYNDIESNKLNELEFDTTDSNSIIVNCFLEKTSFDSISSQCSIADRQIIRILGTNQAYFIPIYTAKNCLGVIAVGVDKNAHGELRKNHNLIRLLANELAKKYAELTGKESQREGISFTEFGKIIHEVRNPLTIINNYLYILGKKIESDHLAHEEINFIKEEIDRVGKILTKAKDPSSYAADTVSELDINRLIIQLDGFFKKSLFEEKKIESQLTLDFSIPKIHCNEDKLKQILMNIIKNAAEALSVQGSVQISTRDNCIQNGNAYVEITIQDNGPGIDNEILKSLFQPVASTKEGHSGLGLSIVSNLVSELSGNIACYSSQQTGTEFKILIPRLPVENETK